VIEVEVKAHVRRIRRLAVSFRQGCMNSHTRPAGTVGAPYLVIRKPHDVAVIMMGKPLALPGWP
jgi:hypothetical protein